MAIDHDHELLPSDERRGRAGSRAWEWPLVVSGAAAILVGITVAHLVEDFVYGVPQSWGFSTAAGGVFFGLLYAVHVLLIVLAARDHPLGYLGNAMVAAGWFVAAVVDHTDDILYADPYRQGLVSKALEVGVVAGGLALAVLAYLAWEARRSDRSAPNT